MAPQRLLAVRCASCTCAAVASGLAAAGYAFHGWSGLSLLGGGFVTLALLLYLTEFRRGRVLAAA